MILHEWETHSTSHNVVIYKTVFTSQLTFAQCHVQLTTFNFNIPNWLNCRDQSKDLLLLVFLYMVCTCVACSMHMHVKLPYISIVVVSKNSFGEMRCMASNKYLTRMKCTTSVKQIVAYYSQNLLGGASDSLLRNSLMQ